MPVTISPADMADAIEYSRIRLTPFREQRHDNYKQFAVRYGQDHKSDDRVLPLIQHYVSTLRGHLVPRQLKFKGGSKTARHRLEAQVIAAGATHILKDLGFLRTLRNAVSDAILGPMGIVKCGLRAGDDILKVGNSTLNVGEFYCSHVDFDDWFCDPTARCPEELLWEGNAYRVLRQQALELGRWDPRVIESLPSAFGYAAGDGRQESMSGSMTGAATQNGPFDYVELIDVAIYSQDGTIWIATLPMDRQFARGNDFLSVEKWEGPEQGPYERLGFQDLSNNILPVPLVNSVYTLSLTLDRVAKKMARTAAESKTIFAYNRQMADEAEDVLASGHLEGIGVDDVSQMKAIELGGLHSAHVPFLGTGMQWFNLFSNNSQMLSGAPQGLASDTAKEAEMLYNAGMVSVNDHRDACNNFIERVVRHVVFEMRSNPFFKATVPYRLQGGGTIALTYDQSTKEAEYDEVMIEVMPYVPQNNDPVVRTRRLIELAGLEQQLLMSPNYQTWMRLIGNSMDIDELDELMPMDPMVQMARDPMMLGMQPPPPGMPIGPGPIRQPAGLMPQGAGPAGYGQQGPMKPAPFARPGQSTPGSGMRSPAAGQAQPMPGAA